MAIINIREKNIDARQYSSSPSDSQAFTFFQKIKCKSLTLCAVDANLSEDEVDDKINGEGVLGMAEYMSQHGRWSHCLCPIGPVTAKSYEQDACNFAQCQHTHIHRRTAEQTT